MLKRLLLYGLLTSGLQVLLYTLTLGSIWFISTVLHHPDFISGYNLYLSIILFIFIVTIQNLLTTLINKKWFTWTAYILTTFFYFVGWGEDFHSWPLETAIFLIVGIAVLTSKPYIDRRVAIRWT